MIDLIYDPPGLQYSYETAMQLGCIFHALSLTPIVKRLKLVLNTSGYSYRRPIAGDWFNKGYLS